MNRAILRSGHQRKLDEAKIKEILTLPVSAPAPATTRPAPPQIASTLAGNTSGQPLVCCNSNSPAETDDPYTASDTRAGELAACLWSPTQ